MTTQDKATDIQAALNALKEQFSRKIPAKVDGIRQSWEQLQSEPEKKNIFELLHRQIHNLTGTAATYGFDELASLAKSIELMLQDVLTENHAIWTEMAIHEVNALLVKLEDVARNGEDGKAPDMGALAAASIPFPGGEITNKLIYLVDDDVDFLATMQIQIQTFGYDVEVFSDLAKFDESLEHQTPAVVIMNVIFGEREKAGIEHISHINATHKQPLKTIFITGSQDVLTRLDAVRANGLAYFPKPVLVEQLIDALDRLTHQGDEEPYRIAIIDDSPEQSGFAALTLQQAGMETREVNEPLQLFHVLDGFQPDLILMDLYMPKCNGLELSKVIRQMDTFISIPIVFLSSESSQEVQMWAMSYGGDDFLTKPVQPWHLVSAITSRVQRSRTIRKLAETDGLTGLLNHTKSKERLEAELARARREKTPLAFAMLDIDHFKHVNDTYGHPAGDRVLKSIANMLKQSLRQYDSIGRYGGEEFIVILPNTDTATAKTIMDKMRTNFSKISHYDEEEPFSCNFSCGIASFPDFDNGTTISEEADKALYVAKEGGRNLVVVAKDNH